MDGAAAAMRDGWRRGSHCVCVAMMARSHPMRCRLGGDAMRSACALLVRALKHVVRAHRLSCHCAGRPSRFYVAMTVYSVKPENVTKTVKASGAYLRVHFKNTRETAHALNGLTLEKAKAYLGAVKDHKRCVPFTRFNGGTGRTSQAKEFGVTMGRWPIKSVELIESLLENAAANAEVKGLDASKLFISHIQVNRAPKQRRRTYRAHGRINPYQSSPSHVEIILTEKAEAVPKADEPAGAAHSAAGKALTRRRAAVQRTRNWHK